MILCLLDCNDGSGEVPPRPRQPLQSVRESASVYNRGLSSSEKIPSGLDVIYACPWITGCFWTVAASMSQTNAFQAPSEEEIQSKKCSKCQGPVKHLQAKSTANAGKCASDSQEPATVAVALLVIGNR
jgi:hypothetical protein